MGNGHDTGDDGEVGSQLRRLAAELTGADPNSLKASRLIAAARTTLGGNATPEKIASAAKRRNRGLIHSLTRAAVARDTYFCRHPADYYAVADHIRRLPARKITAWSAGCATGEETYSLAATLLAAGCVEPEVLGTDLLPEHIGAANRANYRRWSVRVTGLFPLLDPLVPGRYTIRNDVHDRVRFRVHNLLHPIPPRRFFDIILCRNVVKSLPDDAQQTVLQNLVRILTPGGLLILSEKDCEKLVLPDSLDRLPNPNVWAFRREGAPEPVTADREQPNQPRKPRLSWPPPAPRAAATSKQRPTSTKGLSLAVQEHIAALTEMKPDRHDIATLRMSQLIDRWPTYLPARFDAAVLDQEVGRLASAAAHMEDVAAITEGLPPAMSVDGPDVLPARFYRTIATDYLALNR